MLIKPFSSITPSPQSSPLTSLPPSSPHTPANLCSPNELKQPHDDDLDATTQSYDAVGDQLQDAMLDSEVRNYAHGPRLSLNGVDEFDLSA